MAVGNNMRLYGYNSPDYKLQVKWQNLLHERSDLFGKLPSQWHCNRSMLRGNGYGNVDLVVAVDAEGNRRGSFHNLSHCHSMWSCPYCTPRRLAEQAHKVNCIIKHQAKLGYTGYMITMTIPHQKRDSLKDLIDQLRWLRHYAHNSAGGKDLHALGWGGSITSTEVVYSDFNGWHPHLHCLFFIKDGNEGKLAWAVDRFRQFYVKAYYEKYGVPDYAYDVTYFETKSVYLSIDGDGNPRPMLTGDYICDWGADDELVKASNCARRSCNPFMLLDSDNPKDINRFIEYALVTKGLNRIAYSTGIQRNVNFLQRERGEPPNAPIEEEVVASLQYDDWCNILEDELSSRIPHRWNLIRAATIGFNAVMNYCILYQLPLPSPPKRRLMKKPNNWLFDKRIMCETLKNDKRRKPQYRRASA